ncbi:hypothetical protein ACFPOI_17790 [Nonomuraea angiospora]|uniref:ABC-type branched-subunit amino acid transport system ATPase component n=1 Tax=Nonomuraea angiospora TaxID=46172 RepID=A0ABR9MIB1_9ACTN|nr:hypothetical protein [Nonomuraea angiospora]MBE1592499.1 ABC-type branched-subunit amino acid transport system ATPase component [Nonomuraea angiospora]
MIEVRELTKRYGGVTAVRELSFTVRRPSTAGPTPNTPIRSGRSGR